MSFLWPAALLLLLAIPLGVGLYRSRERRRASKAAASGWRTSASASGSTARLARRRIPAACMVVGVTILVFSLARPEAAFGVPRLEGTILLAFDVSGSMAATDVAPSRMEAAKTAALDFVDRQPPSVRFGVVVFSDSSFSTQAPTDDRELIVNAITRLEPERGTSLGRGILESLTLIATANDPRSTDYYTNGSADPTPGPTPVPAGVYEPAIIVLLTDGENTDDSDPFEAAQAAKDRGIRIDTVGIGTEAGTDLEVEGFRVHTALDSDVLKQLADATDGTYYEAASETDLSAIYDDVERHLVIRTEPMELTAVFATLGFIVLLVGAAVSLRWFGRAP